MIGWSFVIHSEKWVRWPVENEVFVRTDGTNTHVHTYTYIPHSAGLHSAAEEQQIHENGSRLAALVLNSSHTQWQGLSEINKGLR